MFPGRYVCWMFGDWGEGSMSEGDIGVLLPTYLPTYLTEDGMLFATRWWELCLFASSPDVKKVYRSHWMYNIMDKRRIMKHHWVLYGRLNNHCPTVQEIVAWLLLFQSGTSVSPHHTHDEACVPLLIYLPHILLLSSSCSSMCTCFLVETK